MRLSFDDKILLLMGMIIEKFPICIKTKVDTKIVIAEEEVSMGTSP